MHQILIIVNHEMVKRDNSRSTNFARVKTLDTKRHFRLLWHRWTEFNETWQKARKSGETSSTKFVFFGPIVMPPVQKGTNTTRGNKFKLLKFNLDLWPSLTLTFDPKIKRIALRITGNTCVKYHHFRSKDNRVIVRKFCKVQSPSWPWPLSYWPQKQ